METINKLLKKQAPKTNRRVALLPGDESPDGGEQRANPVFVRWISSKEGSKLAIPDDMVAGPMAPVFGLGGGKMVEEVL
jgi:Ino eighty subunit 2